MDIFAELDAMQQRIHDGNWSAFSDHYSSLCANYNADIASIIRRTDLSPYLDDVSSAFASSFAIATEHKCPAIYFEYDLDNNWDSNFFICPQYNPPDADDDDWACDSDHRIVAGSQDDFAAIYIQTDNFCNNDESTAITLYLISRTTELLNTVIRGRESPGINICLGFHDQNPIHRLRCAT
jgi:hypothetical protein